MLEKILHPANNADTKPVPPTSNPVLPPKQGSTQVSFYKLKEQAKWGVGVKPFSFSDPACSNREWNSNFSAVIFGLALEATCQISVVVDRGYLKELVKRPFY